MSLSITTAMHTIIVMGFINTTVTALNFTIIICILIEGYSYTGIITIINVSIPYYFSYHYQTYHYRVSDTIIINSTITVFPTIINS